MPRLWISRISRAAVPVGNRDGDLAVESAGPPQGGIEGIGQVGRGDDDHVLPLGQPVHQGQELGDDPFLDVADDLFALGRDGVDLVQEDDAGSIAGGLVEDLAEMGLALAVELVDDLRAVHREETSVGLMGHGTGDQRLAAAGRPVQQNALGWVDAQPLEHFGIAQRQLDDLANAMQLAFEAADILVGDRPRFLGLGWVAPWRGRTGIWRSPGRFAA